MTVRDDKNGRTGEGEDYFKERENNNLYNIIL